MTNDTHRQTDSGGDYVFIVGLPRTGTKLVRDILRQSRSTAVRISPETWFFGDRFRSGLERKIRRFGPMDVDSNVLRLVDYMYSGRYRKTYWNLLADNYFDLPRDRMADSLLASDRSLRGIYITIMREFAFATIDKNDKRRVVFGDKTPGHLYFVEKLIAWFPDCRIVHTVRDPRAIAASEILRLERKIRPYVFSRRIGRAVVTPLVLAYITVTYRRAMQLHRQYEAQYPNNYLISKYEELVGEPNSRISRLCQFTGVEQSAEMNNPSKFGSSFNQAKGQRGFDVAALQRWRSHLGPVSKRWLGRLADQHESL